MSNLEDTAFYARCDEESCRLPNCPVLNLSQCPVRRMRQATKALKGNKHDSGLLHEVDVSRISLN